MAEATVRELIRTGRTIASVEACTGGLIAQYLTAVPGSEGPYLGGLISPAVSSETVALVQAVRLAHQAREQFGSDLGLAAAGTVGLGPGVDSDSIGKVYLALVTAEGSETRLLKLGAEQPREVIQKRAAKLGPESGPARFEGDRRSA